MTSKQNHFYLLSEEVEEEVMTKGAETEGATKGATKAAAKAAAKAVAKATKATKAAKAAKAAKETEELVPLRLQLSETFSNLREKERFWINARACDVFSSLDIIVNHLELKRVMDQLISEIEKVGKVPYHAPCEKCNRKGRKNKMFIQRLPSGSVAAVCRYCKYSTARFPDESLKRGLLDDF